METDRRHSVNVTASPLADQFKRELWGEQIYVPTPRGEPSETDNDTTQVTDPQQTQQVTRQVTADVATQLMPQELHLTQRIYQQGQRSVEDVGQHTARAGRDRASRRRMRDASRIAYRPTKPQSKIPGWYIFVMTLWFAILCGVFVYIALGYLGETVDRVNAC